MNTNEIKVDSQKNNERNNLPLTDSALKSLLTAAKWAKFLAILGYIVIIFILLAGIILGLLFRFTDFGESLNNVIKIMTPGWASLLYIIIGITGLLPVYYLNSFSNLVTRAINNNDSAYLTKALRRLKYFFKYIGIYILVIIAIYIIFVVALIGTTLLVV